MRKFLGILFVFTGSVFSLFMINVMLCLFIPVYHDTLMSLVNKDEEKTETITIDFDEEPRIPLSDGEFRSVDYSDPDRVTGIITDTTKTPEIKAEVTTGNDSAREKEKDNCPEIIDKTYHEDCGSDGGYWVITYSDGSIGIE